MTSIDTDGTASSKRRAQQAGWGVSTEPLYVKRASRGLSATAELFVLGTVVWHWHYRKTLPSHLIDKGLGLWLGVVKFHNHGVDLAVIGISP